MPKQTKQYQYQHYPDTYSEPCQTSKMTYFAQVFEKF